MIYPLCTRTTLKPNLHRLHHTTKPTTTRTSPTTTNRFVRQLPLPLGRSRLAVQFSSSSTTSASEQAERERGFFVRESNCSWFRFFGKKNEMCAIAWTTPFGVCVWKNNYCKSLKTKHNPTDIKCSIFIHPIVCACVKVCATWNFSQFSQSPPPLLLQNDWRPPPADTPAWRLSSLHVPRLGMRFDFRHSCRRQGAPFFEDPGLR